MDRRHASDRPLKILLTSTAGFPVLGYGGGHSILRGLARSIKASGHEILVVLGGNDEVNAARIDGVQYLCQDAPLSLSGFVRTAAATLPLLRSFRPDLVCCLSGELPFVAAACGPLGIPVSTYILNPAIHRVDFSLPGLRNTRKHLGQFFQWVGCRLKVRVMTISAHTTRQVIDEWRIPPDAVFTLGTGIDEIFTHSAAQPSTRVAGEPLRLISTGRISLVQKPLDRVAEALATTDVPWAHWTIVGTGEHDAEIRACVERLGIADRVRLVGFKSPLEVSDSLASHDLVILPSRYESFFLTVYESVARERPVVTNDVAEIRSTLGTSPSVVIAGDQTAHAYGEALREAWCRLESGAARDPELSARVRTEYSWAHIGSRFITEVRRLLA
jgi:glycosyltransferase involved in cell wall biosynthesis